MPSALSACRCPNGAADERRYPAIPSRAPSTRPCMHAGETYYDILGVGVDADEDEIRSAYRRRAKELHPDVNREVRTPSATPCHAGPRELRSFGRCGPRPRCTLHAVLS